MSAVVRRATRVLTGALRLAGPPAFLPLLTLCASCGGSAVPPSPALARGWARHVVVVSLGRCRADHLSIFGHGRNTCGKRIALKRWLDHTLEVLADQGTLFSQAFVPRGTLEGGMGGWLLGAVAAGSEVASAAPSLAETLRANGWKTVLLHSGRPLPERAAIARGFEQRIYDPFPHMLMARLQEAVDWSGKRGIFLWIHLDLPGSPSDLVAGELFEYVKTFLGSQEWGGFDYTARGLELFARERVHLGGELRRRLAARYDARLSYLDDCLRGFLFRLSAEFAILPDALLAVVGSSGCELGDRDGYVGSARSARDAALHVPLLLRSIGGIPAGRVERRLVQAADLYPTILRAVDIAAPEALVGRDLLAPQPDARRIIAGVSSDGARTLRTARYRLILPPPSAAEATTFHHQVELYDSSLPGWERLNLAGDLPEIVDELSAYFP